MSFDTTRPIYLQVIELHKGAPMTGKLRASDKILYKEAFQQDDKQMEHI